MIDGERKRRNAAKGVKRSEKNRRERELRTLKNRTGQQGQRRGLKLTVGKDLREEIENLKRTERGYG